MKHLIFNWKMNPQTLSSSLRLFDSYILYLSKNKIKSWKIIVAPPFVFLDQVSKILKKYPKLRNKVFLASQNSFWREKGAFTGEISPLMLKKIGVKYVILGHSERRKYFFEDSEIIAKKITALKKENLIPIICWGEEKRNEKPEKYLKDILKNIPSLKEILLAYEPIWAIGTGNPISREEAENKNKIAKKTISLFRNKFKKVHYLYGGSINAKDISIYLNSNIIDGFLVGSASLKTKEVLKIFEIINNGKN